VERAVTDFQPSLGLVSDGVVGPQTWQALDATPVDGVSAR
jgi:peptidoglycan hydrolase-like protein with peptidoglycan-binding domain